MVGRAPDDGAVEVCGASAMSVVRVVSVVAGACAGPLLAGAEVLVLICEPQGATVVALQEAVSRFFMRPHSLVSMLRPQCALIATQSAK